MNNNDKLKLKAYDVTDKTLGRGHNFPPEKIEEKRLTLKCDNMDQQQNSREKITTAVENQTGENQLKISLNSHKTYNMTNDYNKIITSNGCLQIDNGASGYIIELAQLPLTREDGGSKLSEWIVNLTRKTWVGINTLYELGKIIKKKFPRSGIDWYRTFYCVEAQFLFQQMFEVSTNKETKMSCFDSVLFQIKTMRDADFRLEAARRTEQKLQDYNFL